MMPRFHFDLVGNRTVVDHRGMPFADAEVAARYAMRLAEDLGRCRPELRETACVVMTDELRDSLTYLVSIHTPYQPRVDLCTTTH
jgi:hypothetical protein